MKNLVITEEIWKEGNMYTAYCSELDVASCGTTIKEAQKISLKSLKFSWRKPLDSGHLRRF